MQCSSFSPPGDNRHKLLLCHSAPCHSGHLEGRAENTLHSILKDREACHSKQVGKSEGALLKTGGVAPKDPIVKVLDPQLKPVVLDAVQTMEARASKYGGGATR